MEGASSMFIASTLFYLKFRDVITLQAFKNATELKVHMENTALLCRTTTADMSAPGEELSLVSKPSKQGKKEAEKLHDRKHIFWTHLKLLLCGWTSLFTQKTTTTHRIILCQHARKRIAVGRKLAVSFKATLRTLSKHTSSHLYNMEVSQHTVPLLLLNPQLFYVQ